MNVCKQIVALLRSGSFELAKNNMEKKQFCQCSCYFTNNIFLRDYDTHVVFKNRQQFEKDYSNVLIKAGCQQLEDVIKEIEIEIKRRKSLVASSIERTKIIAKEYKPLHNDIYTLKEEFFSDKFLEIVKIARESTTAGHDDEDLISHLTEHPNRVYSFPVFKQEFCKKLVEEIKHFEESPMPKERPNTMNQYGILLAELGFQDSFLLPLRTEYLMPLSRILFPDWTGKVLDSHKAFVVTYQISNDVDLAFHYDNAEVTINVCLGGDYADGDLYFGDMRNVANSNRSACWRYEHELGKGILHRGQHKHGALPITSGERYNLIIWMRSSEVRNKLCPMCDKTPDLVPVEAGYGDGFRKTSEN